MAKWSKISCTREAQRFSTEWEFAQASPTIYSVALKHGWLKDFTWLTKAISKSDYRDSIWESSSTDKPVKWDYGTNESGIIEMAMQNTDAIVETYDETIQNLQLQIKKKDEQIKLLQEMVSASQLMDD